MNTKTTKQTTEAPKSQIPWGWILGTIAVLIVLVLARNWFRHVAEQAQRFEHVEPPSNEYDDPISGQQHSLPSIIIHPTLSPDDRTIAMSYWSLGKNRDAKAEIRLFDTASKKLRHRLMLDDWMNPYVQFSGDGRYLAVIDLSQKRNGVWDVETGLQTDLQLPAHAQPLWPRYLEPTQRPFIAYRVRNNVQAGEDELIDLVIRDLETGAEETYPVPRYASVPVLDAHGKLRMGHQAPMQHPTMIYDPDAKKVVNVIRLQKRKEDDPKPLPSDWSLKGLIALDSEGATFVTLEHQYKEDDWEHVRERYTIRKMANGNAVETFEHELGRMNEFMHKDQRMLAIQVKRHPEESPFYQGTLYDLLTKEVIGKKEFSARRAAGGWYHLMRHDRMAVYVINKYGEIFIWPLP